MPHFSVAAGCLAGGLMLAGPAQAADSCDALVISDPHNLAWAFNLRGGDIGHTPLALGYAILPREGRARLFLTSGDIDPALRAALDPIAEVAPRADLDEGIASLAGARVRLDGATGTAALKDRVEAAGGTVDVGKDPITAMKAVKNGAEIAGTRAAHLRDGASVVRFLAWLDGRAAAGDLTEIAAVEALEDFRAAGGDLRDVSFPTISGSGPNGAVVHYRVTRETDRPVRQGELFLVDSGAQYPDGTTDITRTVALGQPTDRERHDFTLVMKGHIALGTAIFPEGTCGMQLDALARQFLWKEGLSYLHGTGHGVGHFLNVHEGPQSIRLNYMPAPLTPGMITSNEPGLYREGVHGIRCENLVLTVKAMTTEFGNFYKFETLTLFPFDLRLFDTTLMTDAEIQWINDYHREVRERLSPLLDEAERLWLEAKTAPLMRDTIY